jgi:hypothetical protein
MALSYTFEPQNHLIVITGTGGVALEERVDLVNRILSDRTLPSESSILIDVRRVAPPPSSDDLSRIGFLIQRLQSRFGARIAILNAAVGHVTLSHLIACRADGEVGEVQAFVSESEAREWLK